MRRRWTLEELDARLVPTYLGNQVFPLDNPWNQVVAGAPVAANSAAIMSAIVARHGAPRACTRTSATRPSTTPCTASPLTWWTRPTPKVPVTFAPDGYGDESDSVLVPIPAERGHRGRRRRRARPTRSTRTRGDSHLLVYDKDANVLYELGSAARPNEPSYPYGDAKPLGVWGAWQVSYWDLNNNSFRTIGATSADAAGLPIMPGLVRPDEAHPAAAGAGAGHRPRHPHDRAPHPRPVRLPRLPRGQQLDRTRPAADGRAVPAEVQLRHPGHWSPEAKAIAQAMKTYGLIVADNGSRHVLPGDPVRHRGTWTRSWPCPPSRRPTSRWWT